MTFSPSSRSRRLQERQAEATEQFVTFRLHQEWFALPVQSVQRVQLLGDVFGDPQRSGVSLTIYENQELLVVDVGHLIFKEAPQPLEFLNTNLPTSRLTSPRFLIVLENTEGKLVGLPVDSKPTLRRFLASAVKALPPTYTTAASLQCVSALMIQEQDQKPIFLLQPDRLFNVQPMLG
jgi:purine-binding chemotaxis protein CheW